MGGLQLFHGRCGVVLVAAVDLDEDEGTAGAFAGAAECFASAVLGVANSCDDGVIGSGEVELGKTLAQTWIGKVRKGARVAYGTEYLYSLR